MLWFALCPTCNKMDLSILIEKEEVHCESCGEHFEYEEVVEHTNREYE